MRKEKQADEYAFDPNLGSHGLVDMVDFQILVNCTTILEGDVTILNHNAIKLSTLVNKLVQYMITGVSDVALGGGAFVFSINSHIRRHRPTSSFHYP